MTIAQTQAIEVSSGGNTAPLSIPLVMVVDQDTLLLLGSAGDMFAEAEARFGDGRVPCGRWIAHKLGERDGVSHFIALLRGEDIIRRLNHATFLIDEASERRQLLPTVGRIELEAAPLIGELNALQVELAPIFQFLRQHILAAGGETSRRARAFLIAFLGAISTHDGFVEIVGLPHDGGILLQGWAMHLQSRRLEIGLLGAGLELAPSICATFERSDLLQSSRGIVLYAREIVESQADRIRHVYFLADGRYYHLDVLPSRAFNEGESAIAHLKHMLPSLVCQEPVRRGFHRICRPRFMGQNTVAEFDRPVRVACDVAVQVEDAGLLLHGWLLDPGHLVRMVLLKSTKGFYKRIDQDWAREQRPDLNEGYGADPLFAGRLSAHEIRHGFLTFVPRKEAKAEDEQFYIEVVLHDEACAFLPLTLFEGDLRELCRRMLGNVDLHDVMSEAAIERHLAPFVAAAWRRPLPAQQAVTAFPFGAKAEPPVVSVVCPLETSWGGFDANLARLGNEPGRERVELVVVVGAAAAREVNERLRRAAVFHGLSGRLLVCNTEVDPWEATQIGINAAAAGRVLLIGAHVLPKARGWLHRMLVASHALGPQALVSPTLLYEDDSVRYAGDPGGSEAGMPALAGYSRSWISGSGPQPARAPAPDCVLGARRFFMTQLSEGPGLIDGEMKRRDALIRMTEGQGGAYWLPEVELYAIDETTVTENDGEHWRRVAKLVDRLSFAAARNAAPNPAPQPETEICAS